jgi:F0F1-type ATP synthase assembly protein I
VSDTQLDAAAIEGNTSMDQDPAALRHQIEATRASLAEKVRLLEERLRGKVGAAQAGVEKIGATVNETIQTVQGAFDLDHQFRQHPWLMLGGCILAGFALGSRLKHGGVEPGQPKRESAEAAGSGTLAPDSQPAKPGMFNPFQEEIEIVKGVAIGLATGYFRDAAKQALPQLAPQIEEIMDGVTVKLGGTPIPGPLVLPSACSRDSGGKQKAPQDDSMAGSAPPPINDELPPGS